MKLAQVQAHLAARITGAAALAALGDPFIYDPQQTTARAYDPDTLAIVADSGGLELKDAIAARLIATGVSIEIDWPLIASVESTVGAAFSRIACAVFVAERQGHTHTPTGLALADAVIAALKSRTSPGSAWVVHVSDYLYDDSEPGSVLHIITASIDVRNP